MKINFRKTAAGYAFEVPASEEGFYVTILDLVKELGVVEYVYCSGYDPRSIKITKGEYEGVSLVGFWDGFIDHANRKFVLISDF